MKFGVIDLLAAHGTKAFFVRARAAKQPFLNLLLAVATRFFDKGAAQFLSSTKQLIFIQFARFAFSSIACTFPPRIRACNSFLLQGAAGANHLPFNWNYGCFGWRKWLRGHAEARPTSKTHIATRNKHPMTEEEEEAASGVIQRAGRALTIEPHCCFTTVFDTFCDFFTFVSPAHSVLILSIVVSIAVWYY